MRHDITDLILRAGGAIRAADHPTLRHRLARLSRSGMVGNPLPGIYCLGDAVADIAVAALVGQLWAGPDAVLTPHRSSLPWIWLPVPTVARPSTRRFGPERD